ncbi:PKD domain-containing protein [Agromyces sp. Marseille-Q5079]|uniref:PKD domain-containing protein n=1 Tax=Agromyces sp. Marseille-Q5079 TaxID=3439059 RepID=UPI003D9C8CF7
MIVALLLSATGGLVANAAQFTVSGCSRIDVLAGTCEVASLVDPDEVELVGTREGGSAGNDHSEGTYATGEDDDNLSPTAPKREPIEWPEVCQAGHLECIDVPVPTTPPSTPEPGVAPTVVTLRDIAAFRPAAPGNDMEPGGWAVVGLPANFVAAASAQVVPGTLLGQPADVRFTPVGFRWLHSDGSVVESGSAGASWAELGQKEFTATGTSHVYAEAGEYTVTLEVALAAEYRFGGSGWQSIAGTLSVASEPRPVLVGEMDTVLTRGDCTAAPDDPGC